MGDFSFFEKGILQTTPEHTINLEDFVEGLKEENELINQIREETDKDKRNELKKKLSYVTFAGIFEKRNNKSLIESSGLTCLDFDEVENIEEMKKELSKDKHTHAVFISPSGNGLKLIVKIPKVKNDDEYKGFWRAIVKHYNQIKTDEGTKDISRACYISHDPKPYFNPDSEVFSESIDEEQTTLSKEDKPKDTSRSGREFAEVCKLIKKGLSDEEINREMMTFSKWKESPQQYRELTLRKAEEKVKEEGESKQENNKSILFDRITQTKEYYKTNPFFYDVNKIWWKWDKKNYRWVKCDEVDILGNSYEEDGQNIVSGKERAEIINALKHVGRLKRPKEPLDCWIQFENKIYDIESGESFEASPEYFITNPIPYEMGENEDTPTIDKLFSEWVGEEHKRELYEIISFAQAPKYFIHRIICLIGSGANGKSTFLTLLRKYLNDENVVSSSLDTLMRNRFEGSKLYKKLVCLMGETNFGTLTQTDYIKGLSGEDKLRVEFKNKDSFDAVNNAKLILATNSLPATADKTEGFYRRWKIIKFENKFLEEKDILAEIPEKEYNNLALKCFNILAEMWKKRVFTNDGNFEQRKEEYEKHSNPLMLFLSQNFVKDVNFDYPSEDFREEFLCFLAEHGFRELSPKAITQQLKNNGFDVKMLNQKEKKGRYILGLRANVSDVADVSLSITQNPIGNLIKTPDTSDTSDTQTLFSYENLPQPTDEELKKMGYTSRKEFEEVLNEN